MKKGAAFLARRFGVPILPIYIDGARTWHPGEKSKVVVGTPFTTGGLKYSAVNQRIQQDILDLKAQIA